MKQFQLLFHVICFSCNSQHQKINGVSFVASKDSITSEHVQPVLNVHSNYVALMPFGFFQELNSPIVLFNTHRQWFGETQKGLLQYAKKFQEEKVGIMVKPQIWVWRGVFTGDINMDSEEQWTFFENSYSDFILTYAKTAQDMGAEILCIGTELEQFVLTRPVYWKRLIKDIRRIYKGKLTYATNWNEYLEVSFWSELDYIGIDAYFPLSEEKSPSILDFEKEAERKGGWRGGRNGGSVRRVETFSDLVEANGGRDRPSFFKCDGVRTKQEGGDALSTRTRPKKGG